MGKIDDAKVSIIIPVYNTEKYIERCVRSVLEQTYKNLEIICIDDGSDDESGRILDRLALEDNRVVVLHKENEGVTAARNMGLEYVTGKYIGFVDSDDYIEKIMYEKMVHKIEESNADIVTCGYNFDYDGTIVKAENIGNVPDFIMTVREFLPYIYERDKYKGVASYLWTRLIRREVILGEDNSPKITFCKTYGGLDDIVFISEVNLRAETILYVDDALYNYFQREGSIVHDNATQLKQLTWVKAYEKIIENYVSVKMDKKVIDLLIRMYVYRCGKILESAKVSQSEYAEQIEILRKNIKTNLLTYFEGNLEHLDRIQWIVNLLLEE